MKPATRKILWLLALLALAAPACMLFSVGSPTRPTLWPDATVALPSTNTPAAPVEVLPTATEAPTEPVKVTLTPSASAATVTAIVAPTTALTPTQPPAAPGMLPEGMTAFRHPEIPDFAFPADPNVWGMVKSADVPWTFLVNKSNPSCGIDAVPGRGIGTPERVLRWQLGRLYWFVYDYGKDALVSIEQPKNLFLELNGFDNPACRKAQQAVLERVLLEDELTGKQALAPLPTATTRPPVAGFDCPNTPPTRLRAGDQAHIVTNDLLLRSKPEATEDTKIRLYDADAPVMVEVIDGPVCTAKFVYWKVRIGTIGEGSGDPITGWMAEGDLKEYYLAPGY